MAQSRRFIKIIRDVTYQGNFPFPEEATRRFSNVAFDLKVESSPFSPLLALESDLSRARTKKRDDVRETFRRWMAPLRAALEDRARRAIASLAVTK